jgi:hypothetical protein
MRRKGASSSERGIKPGTDVEAGARWPLGPQVDGIPHRVNSWAPGAGFEASRSLDRPIHEPGAGIKLGAHAQDGLDQSAFEGWCRHFDPVCSLYMGNRLVRDELLWSSGLTDTTCGRLAGRDTSVLPNTTHTRGKS